MRTFLDCLALIALSLLCWPILVALIALMFVFIIIAFGVAVVTSPIWIPIVCVTGFLNNKDV